MSKEEFLKEHLKSGEVYAGLLLGENGAPDAHLIVMAGEIKDATWDKAMKWAASIGGELPTRREFRLLYANAKSAFMPWWHWSCEQHSGLHSWGQEFYEGTQEYDRKSACGPARAVRRLPI